MAKRRELDPTTRELRDFKTEFDAFWSEVASLWSDWRLFRRLYAADPKSIEIMNSTAPAFFGHLQVVLGDRILLQIAKLTDPKAMAGRNNLSLAGVLEAAEPNLAPENLIGLKQQLEAVISAAEPVRKHRHRRIAHADAKTLLKAEPLADVTLREARQAIDAITSFLNALQLVMNDATSSFDHPQMAEYEADEVLEALAQYERDRADPSSSPEFT